MLQVDEIEKTSGGRLRKLFLTFGSVAGLLYVQFASGQPVSWPCAVGCAVIVMAYTSTDTLELAFSSGLLDGLKAKLPGKGK